MLVGVISRHTESDQKLRGPIGVAAGPDDWVYVVENYSNRVSLFDECYKYVRSFGKKGKNDGEFNDPYAVAVSPEGCAYVSDTNNNRIQFFKWKTAVWTTLMSLCIIIINISQPYCRNDFCENKTFLQIITLGGYACTKKRPLCMSLTT